MKLIKKQKARFHYQNSQEKQKFSTLALSKHGICFGALKEYIQQDHCFPPIAKMARKMELGAMMVWRHQGLAYFTIHLK